MTRIVLTGFIFLYGVFFCSLSAWAAPTTLPEAWQSVYDQGVIAYQSDKPKVALQQFSKVIHAVPESQESLYYYAICLAKLGRVQAAKAAYENVIQLNTNSEAADLAREGLSYLPNLSRLDAPPQIQGGTPTVQAVTASSTPPVQSAAAPQMNANMMDWMMMSSLGGGQGGMNAMMLPMMQQMMQQQNQVPGQSTAPPGNTNPGYSPEAMRSMLMNQMMQNMDFFGSDHNKD